LPPLAASSRNRGGPQVPLTLQCQGSLGRLYMPKLEALADNQPKQELLRPQLWKSTARPSSCCDDPGMAVGGRHCPDGIW